MSGESNELERWDAYLEGLRKKPGELDDMLPMFEYWVYSGYASEVEWRLAIEVTDLRKRLDAMEDLGEDTKVTLNYAPDANTCELADGIARKISLRGLCSSHRTSEARQSCTTRRKWLGNWRAGRLGTLPTGRHAPVLAAPLFAIPLLVAIAAVCRRIRRSPS